MLSGTPEILSGPHSMEHRIPLSSNRNYHVKNTALIMWFIYIYWQLRSVYILTIKNAGILFVSVFVLRAKQERRQKLWKSLSVFLGEVSWPKWGIFIKFITVISFASRLRDFCWYILFIFVVHMIAYPFVLTKSFKL